ncbi:MAG: leucyl/phenylalanyl-tRNA--protein transferase [Alphaproteobacteria bacterium]|nr:leucyl/phenylalanyl-tRNA--protein transferase [Alphaproteobacteria bacterium]
MTRITLDMLLRAYAQGIFPMSESRHDPHISWFDPHKRGILPLEKFHVPKRLARTIRDQPYRVRIDAAFQAVVEGCASPRPGRWTTWINDSIIQMFTGLASIGHAHSVECWENDELVGGLYGVSLGAAFFGESMFSLHRDASKIALTYLVARLRAGGFTLLDTQFVTTHLQKFGALEISRSDYLRRLKVAVAKDADFHRMPAETPPDEVLELTRATDGD